MLSSRPVYGRLDEYGSVARLRQAANTAPDPVPATVLELLAVHRELGVQAARLVWEEAGDVLRPVAVVQLLITMCVAVGTESGRLSAPHTVQLVNGDRRPLTAAALRRRSAARGVLARLLVEFRTPGKSG
ncbi:hypothetical protein ACFU7Y_33155 [Kitasatospora sp. NPDC057542]|uniref:hypothetical protein n=1 Tax=Kitasatospora sp. NPDC057542 TaxID=3346162 RepID=UPI0036B6CCF7